MHSAAHLTTSFTDMANNGSPYAGKPAAEWPEITKSLIAQHPLKPQEILEIAILAWDSVWSTQIGRAPAQIPLRDVNPPATVIGYFFEKIFAKELSARYPKIWRGTQTGDEKDLHCIDNQFYSTEIKASGQLGTKIFGNRSYGQKLENQALAKKDKSGYYITVNFFADRLNLVRFGWIDADDWKAQASPTGQMAGLDESVYRYKLVPLRGDYVLNAPVNLLAGVGGKLAEQCRGAGLSSIADVLAADGKLPSELKRVYAAAVIYKKELGA